MLTLFATTTTTTTMLFSAFFTFPWTENVLNSDRKAEVLHVTVTCNSDKQSRLPDNLFFHHTEIAVADLVNTSASQQIRNFNCGYCSTFVRVYFPCLLSLFTHTHTDMVLITNSIFIWKEEKLHICHLKLTADPHSSGLGGKTQQLLFAHFCSIPAIKGLRLTFSPLKF